MRNSYDSHLTFDLPGRYELNRTRGDDGSTNVSIQCGTHYNDQHEWVGDVIIRIQELEGGIREDKINLPGNYPAALLGATPEMQLGVGISGGSFSSNRRLVIQILMLVVAIEYQDKSYALIAVKTGTEDHELENVEKLTRHMNVVLGGLTLDGKPGGFRSLTMTEVRRALKENASKDESAALSSIRSTGGRSSTARAEKPVKPAPVPAAPAAPARSREEIRSLVEDHIKAVDKAKREAKEAAKLAEKQRDEHIHQALLANGDGMQALRDRDRRIEEQQKAVAAWEDVSAHLAERRAERAEALFAQALEAVLPAEREAYRAAARRETPLLEEAREELKALEEALGKLGMFAFSEKKEKKAQIAETQARISASEQALREAESAFQAAEDAARERLEPRRAEFQAAAEREIVPGPKPEAPAALKQISPEGAALAVGPLLEVGRYYGLSTLRAMLPEYQVDAKTMQQAVAFLKEHDCVAVHDANGAEICEAVAEFPKPTLDRGNLGRALLKIMESGYRYTLDQLVPYFGGAVTREQLASALRAMKLDGEVYIISDAGTQYYRSARAQDNGVFTPGPKPVQPVDTAGIITVPKAIRSAAAGGVKLPKVPEITKEENYELIRLMVEQIYGATPEDVYEKLHDYGLSDMSIQRVRAYLHQLTERGELTVEQPTRTMKIYYPR